MKVNYVLMYGIPYVRYKEFETFEDISKFLVHKGFVNYSIFKKLEDKEEIEMIYRDNDIHYLENFVKEQDKKIERLNKLISQREKKWEKWTTEKTILSTKMSDYLCKYQNIKREYTKQIKISTDRKKEIERLNNIINELEKSIKNKYYEAIDYQTKIRQSDLMQGDYPVKYYLAEQNEQLCNYFLNRLKDLQELKGSNNNE